MPAFARHLIDARGANRSWSLNLGFYGHRTMVVVPMGRCNSGRRTRSQSLEPRKARRFTKGGARKVLVTTKNWVLKEFRFGNRLAFEGIPPPPRCIGIRNLRGNAKQNLAAQSLAGKILISKSLRAVDVCFRASLTLGNDLLFFRTLQGQMSHGVAVEISAKQSVTTGP